MGDDVNKLVINETAARMLGYMDNDDAIGEEIAVETVGEPMQVIGVVKDYHQQALNKGYTGVMLFHKDKIDWIPQRYISVVMKPGDPSELVSQIGEIWNNYFADSSFDYFFLDQFYDRQYRQDEAFGVLMGGFTGLAIFYLLLRFMGVGYVLLCRPYQGDGHSESIGGISLEFVLSVG